MTVNGKAIGVIYPGEYMFADVAPGLHHVRVEWDDPDPEYPIPLGNPYGGAKLVIEVAPDTIYFVRDRTGNDLVAVSADIGHEAVAKCRLGAWRRRRTRGIWTPPVK